MNSKRLLLALSTATVLTIIFNQCGNKKDEEVGRDNDNQTVVSKQLAAYILSEKSESIGMNLEITERFSNDTSFINVVYKQESIQSFELLKEWILLSMNDVELPDFQKGTKYICVEIHEDSDIEQQTFTINAFDFVKESFEKDIYAKYLEDLVFFYQLDGGKTLNEFNSLLQNASQVGEELKIYENNFLNLLKPFYIECEKNGFHYIRMYMLFAWTGATKERKYFDIMNDIFAKCGFEKFTVQELKGFMEFLGAPPVIPWQEDK